MIELVIGLAIATVIVLGICRGNLFACVFLSIPIALITILFGTAGGPASPQWALGGILFLVMLWLPYIVRSLD